VKQLSFTEDGVCTICLTGFPTPYEIEGMVEEYVSGVELLPYELKIMFIDISGLEHMKAHSRLVFSELLAQASLRYQNKVIVVVGGGSHNIRQYISLLCKSLGFADRCMIFEDIIQARSWIADHLVLTSPSSNRRKSDGAEFE
jgi:hypothetical protein